MLKIDILGPFYAFIVVFPTKYLYWLHATPLDLPLFFGM